MTKRERTVDVYEFISRGEVEKDPNCCLSCGCLDTIRERFHPEYLIYCELCGATFTDCIDSDEWG